MCDAQNCKNAALLGFLLSLKTAFLLCSMKISEKVTVTMTNGCGNKRRVGDVVLDKQATPRSETGCEKQLSTYSRHYLSHSLIFLTPIFLTLIVLLVNFLIITFLTYETCCEKQLSTYSRHNLSHSHISYSLIFLTLSSPSLSSISLSYFSLSYFTILYFSLSYILLSYFSFSH